MAWRRCCAWCVFDAGPVAVASPSRRTRHAGWRRAVEHEGGGFARAPVLQESQRRLRAKCLALAGMRVQKVAVDSASPGRTRVRSRLATKAGRTVGSARARATWFCAVTLMLHRARTRWPMLERALRGTKGQWALVRTPGSYLPVPLNPGSLASILPPQKTRMRRRWLGRWCCPLRCTSG